MGPVASSWTHTRMRPHAHIAHVSPVSSKLQAESTGQAPGHQPACPPPTHPPSLPSTPTRVPFTRRQPSLRRPPLHRVHECWVGDGLERNHVVSVHDGLDLWADLQRGKRRCAVHHLVEDAAERPHVRRPPDLAPFTCARRSARWSVRVASAGACTGAVAGGGRVGPNGY